MVHVHGASIGKTHHTAVTLCVCVCVSVYLPENEDLVPTSYIQTVDAPLNVDVCGLGR